jgi:YgiT-type zinc finger domain-containing protein
MKECYFCKGEVKPSQMDYMAQRAGNYVLVRGLAVKRCTQCGEVYLDDHANRVIDSALNEPTALAASHIDVPVVEAY